MKNGTYQTRIISNESQVPPGYRRLRDLVDEFGEADRRRLSDAHGSGLIRAVKIMRTINDRTGATYVHLEDARKFVGKHPFNELSGPKVSSPSLRPLTEHVQLMSQLARIAAAQEKTVEILERLEAIWKGADE